MEKQEILGKADLERCVHPAENYAKGIELSHDDQDKYLHVHDHVQSFSTRAELAVSTPSSPNTITKSTSSETGSEKQSTWGVRICGSRRVSLRLVALFVALVVGIIVTASVAGVLSTQKKKEASQTK